MITNQEELVNRIGEALEECVAQFNSKEFTSFRFATKATLYFIPDSEQFIVVPIKPWKWEGKWEYTKQPNWIACGDLSQDEMKYGITTIRWGKVASKANVLLHGRYTNLPGDIFDVKKQMMLEW